MRKARLLARTVHQRIEDAQPHTVLRKTLTINGKHVVCADLPATAHTMAIDDALELTPMAIKIRVSIPEGRQILLELDPGEASAHAV